MREDGVDQRVIFPIVVLVFQRVLDREFVLALIVDVVLENNLNGAFFHEIHEIRLLLLSENHITVPVVVFNQQVGNLPQRFRIFQRFKDETVVQHRDGVGEQLVVVLVDFGL